MVPISVGPPDSCEGVVVKGEGSLWLSVSKSPAAVEESSADGSYEVPDIPTNLNCGRRKLVIEKKREQKEYMKTWRPQKASTLAGISAEKLHLSQCFNDVGHHTNTRVVWPMKRQREYGSAVMSDLS